MKLLTKQPKRFSKSKFCPPASNSLALKGQKSASFKNSNDHSFLEDFVEETKMSNGEEDHSAHFVSQNRNSFKAKR